MWIDAHAHLDLFDDNLDVALREIEQQRIFTVSNSVGLESYHRNLAIADRCPWVLPIFGVHPWFASEYVHRLDEVAEAIENSPMLGEIGLDFHFVKEETQYPAQRELFDFFLEAAEEQGKWVHLHTKGAERETLQRLDGHKIRRAVVHWYSGPLDVFRELAARGFYFTVGVEVLYSAHVKAIAREVPASQLLTETDNPGGHKSLIGEPGRPGLIRDVVQGLARTRNTSAEALMRMVQANFVRLCGQDPRLRQVSMQMASVRSGDLE